MVQNHVVKSTFVEQDCRTLIDNMNDTTMNSFPQNKSAGHAEQLIIGLSYVALSLFFLIPYASCIYVMLTNKKLGSPAYYYIVMQISVADILQLIFIGLWSGIFMICPSIAEIHLLNRWIGALGLSAWILYITTANLLAINRINLYSKDETIIGTYTDDENKFFISSLIHTCFHSSTANRIFSKKLTKTYLGAISCYALSWFFTFTMSTDTEFLFAPEYFSWIYGESSYSYVASQFELYTDSANICCMIIWYLCIYGAIRAQWYMTANRASKDDTLCFLRHL
uniref:Uncharacterized protein n=1 Tax=Romanomermis culicivorax TaxID=13658 RepID=A0A915HY01_ROMCU